MSDEIIGVQYKDIDFKFYHTPTSEVLIQEIFNDNYKIQERGLEFRDKDVIVDIGANEGFFSILIGKLFPRCQVFAFEPVPRTFFQMVRNVGLNGLVNVHVFNKGIGGAGVYSGVMNVHNQFSGGSSLVDTFDKDNHSQVNVELMPLDELVNPQYFPWIDRIRLMKMDIEGGEYDALYNSSILPRVDYFVGEFHINGRLQAKGYDINELATWVGAQTQLVYFEKCKMAE